MKSHTSFIQLAKDLAVALASCLRAELAKRSTGLKLILGRQSWLDRNRGILIDAEVLELPANLAIGSRRT